MRHGGHCCNKETFVGLRLNNLDSREAKGVNDDYSIEITDINFLEFAYCHIMVIE